MTKAMKQEYAVKKSGKCKVKTKTNETTNEQTGKQTEEATKNNNQ